VSAQVDERGGAALELVLLTPALLCLLLLVVTGGRLVTARNDVDFAARVGARSASVARSTTLATTNAREAVTSSLSDNHVDCASLNVDVDTSQFRAGGQVTTRVRCDVDLSVASFLGLPLTRSVDASFSEPVDSFVEAIR
jgi:Flp pilus assembly protein TadG